MIRAALLIFGLSMLVLSGMVTFIRRDAVEPYYLEFQTYEPGSGVVEACHLFYFHRPLECQPLWFNQIATRSPDGRWWDFTGSTIIYRALASSRKLQEIYHSNDTEFSGEVIWSRDRRFFALVKQTEFRSRDIYRVELATGEITRLTTDARDEWFPAWSFDGERIAFNVRETPEDPARIFTMRADGSDVQSLGLQDAFGPVWSPDSESIIFQSGCSRQVLLLPDISSCPEFNFDLYRVNLTDGQINTVTTMPGNEFSVAYSPDGAWVAFASTVSGSRQIYRVRPDGADLQRLTEDGHNYFPPSWVQTPNFVWQPIFLLMTALMMLSFVWWKKP